MTELLGVLLGCFITYFFSIRLEKKNQTERQKTLCASLNDILKQTKIILVGCFWEGKNVSPYGYIRGSHDETQAIMPLFDNIITEIGILPSSKNKTQTIELYTELKNFLSCNEKYKIRLENLKKFRKEMIPEKFIKLNCKNCLDYFDIEPYLFEEEKNEKSVISKDFFTAQKDLIDDLNNLSNITWELYLRLVDKIDTILNRSWETKNE